MSLSLRPVFLIFLVSVAVLLSFPNPADSQTATSGGLVGIVTDPSEAVVPDADVALQDNSKGTKHTTKANSGGEYFFSFVAPGSYTLTVAHSGFRARRQILHINPGPPSTLNVRLELEGGSTTLKVTGEALLLQAQNGDASSAVSRLQVEQVPNPGNDLTYIAQTAPGVIMNTDGGVGNFSVFGMPGVSTVFTLNGMNYTDIVGNTNPTGDSNLFLGTNQVQEATIVSSGYSGQIGVLAGANVNYITKSGGNQFHGNALYYWNGQTLNANNWFNNATGEPRPFDNANQWAGSIGGPIKKDRLFFFVDTEGLRLLVPQVTQVVLPSPQFEAATIANIDSKFGPTSASDAFYKQMFSLYNGAPGAKRAVPGGISPSDPTGCTGFMGPNGLGTTLPCALHYQTSLGRPTYESLVSARLDWNIRPEDQMFLLVANDQGHQSSYTDPISPLFNFNSHQTWWQAQLVETHLFGASAANQFLIGGWKQAGSSGPANFSDTLTALPTLLSWQDTNTFTNIGTSVGSLFTFNSRQYQISDDMIKFWGNHKFGVGVSFLAHPQHALFTVDQGTLVPFTLDAFFQGGFDPATSSVDTTALYQTFTAQLSNSFYRYILGFYGQEEWHARPNLKLTLALRTEHQSNIICKNRCFARLTGPFDSVSHDPDQPYNQAILVNLKQAYESVSNILWAPRFSFAWQPLGVSHNTVVRGGIGIFYDSLPAFVANFMLNNPPLSNYFAIQGDNIAPNETTSLFKNAVNSNAEFLSGFATGESFSEIKAKVNGFSPPALGSPDHLLRAPQYQRWSLELQQVFGVGTSISVGYFGNHGLHELILNQSANAFGFGTLPPSQCTSPPVPPCADPRFSEVTQLTTAGVSNYSGMVVTFQQRFTGWSQGIFQASYTYGHAFDEASNGGFYSFSYRNSVLVPQDPHNFRGSYGSADYDVRHSFNANYVWEIPVRAALRGHGPDYLVKGWQISGAVFFHTGFPYTVIDIARSFHLQANNFFGPIYAVPVGPPGPSIACGKGAAIPEAAHPCQQPQLLADGTPNPDARFVQSGCETGFNTGNLPSPSDPCGGARISIAQGRNRFRGPGYFATDFAIMKDTKIPGAENVVLGIGLQFFNFFNHPNFGSPDSLSSDPSFGQIFYMQSPPTGILGAGLGGDASPRNIQLKVQLRF